MLNTIAKKYFTSVLILLVGIIGIIIFFTWNFHWEREYTASLKSDIISAQQEFGELLANVRVGFSFKTEDFDPKYFYLSQVWELRQGGVIFYVYKPGGSVWSLWRDQYFELKTADITDEEGDIIVSELADLAQSEYYRPNGVGDTCATRNETSWIPIPVAYAQLPDLPPYCDIGCFPPSQESLIITFPDGIIADQCFNLSPKGSYVDSMIDEVNDFMKIVNPILNVYNIIGIGSRASFTREYSDMIELM